MNNQRGFTLVISVLIISTIMLMIAIAAARGLSSDLSSGQVVESEIKAQALAEGCADYALNKLKQDTTYTGNENLTINGSTCTVRPITTSGGITTVEAYATVSGHPYRLRVTLSSLASFTISSWKRVSTF